MEQYLWTFDDIVRFIDHPDTPVRRWAIEWLTKRFPDRAAESLLTVLDDLYTYNVLSACSFLGDQGDRAKHGPALFEGLKQAEGARFAYIAAALGKLGYREAVPMIAQRLNVLWEGSSASEPSEYLRIVDALGDLGGDQARQALWALLDGFQDGLWAVPPIEAMLAAARPEDVTRLVKTYRRWPPLHSSRRQVAAFGAAAGANRLTEEIGYAIEGGLYEAYEQAAGWLGNDTTESEACWRELERAFERGHRRLFNIVLREVRRIAEQRGDDVDGWLADWEAGKPLGDYQRRATRTRLLLEAFARYPSAHPRQRVQESALGLALLFQWSLDRDDQALLDAAEDRIETLLDILYRQWEHPLPDIVERVANLGPGIVPRLIRRFDPERRGWEPIRIADTIARIARRYIGSCDVAIPLLVEAINDDRGDYVLESCSEALSAIGLPAVPYLAEHVGSEDSTRHIFLCGALGEIPAESAAQAILSQIEQGMPFDDMEVDHLTRIGSPSAIKVLRAVWTEGEHPLDDTLAEALLVLCEINGIQRPELPRWRRIVQEKEAQFEAMTLDLRPWFLEEAPKEEKPRPAAGHTRPRQEKVYPPAGPTLVTHEGDLVAFGRALYWHQGLEEILQILAQESDFDVGDDPEPDGVLRFGWYETEEAVRPSTVGLGRRVLATLALTPETLEIEAMSEERLARCRRRLGDLLGGWIHFLKTETKSMEQALAEDIPADLPEAPALSPEAIAELEDRMLREWLETSIPALEGMTPREAVKTAEGQQMLRDLFQYIERQYERYPLPPGMFRPDYNKAKRMLGLA
jgi:HEAT repeat protein